MDALYGFAFILCGARQPLHQGRLAAALSLIHICGTDNHLMLIDLRDEECTGKDLEQRLDSVHITANKNTVRCV